MSQRLRKRVLLARAAPRIEECDSLTNALIIFFEAASAEETDSRLRGEVYLAQALLVWPHAHSRVGESAEQ